MVMLLPRATREVSVLRDGRETATLLQCRPPGVIGVYRRYWCMACTRSRSRLLVRGRLLLLLLLSSALLLPLLPSAIVQLSHHRPDELTLAIQQNPQLFTLANSRDRKRQLLPMFALHTPLRLLLRRESDRHYTKRGTARFVNLRLEGHDCPVRAKMSSNMRIWHEWRYPHDENRCGLGTNRVCVVLTRKPALLSNRGETEQSHAPRISLDTPRS